MQAKKPRSFLPFELHADLLLMDDREGVIAARRRGFRVAGTLPVLSMAARRGLLNLADAFERLKAQASTTAKKHGSVPRRKLRRRVDRWPGFASEAEARRTLRLQSVAPLRIADKSSSAPRLCAVCVPVSGFQDFCASQITQTHFTQTTHLARGFALPWSGDWN
jgi:hypothetical protein